GGMSVAEEEKFHALFSVVENQLVIEDNTGNLEPAFGDIFSASRRFARIGEFFRSTDAQNSCTVGLSDDAGPGIAEHRVTKGVVAVVVSIKDIADRLVGGFLDGLDHIDGLFGESCIDNDHIVFENDPDVVAAAERDVRSFRTNLRIS